jgi:signal transduction histidine kinase/PleD family two-component response regulator
VWTWLFVCLGGVCAIACGWLYVRRLASARRATGTPVDPLSNPRLFELAEEAAGFGVWEWDLIDQTTVLSAGAARLTGYPPVAIRKSADELLDLIHPDERVLAEVASGEAIANHTGFQFEFRARQPDGSYRWRRNRGRAEYDGGRAVRVVGALSDIHEEKLMLERLAEAADRMSLAEHVAGFGVWELDVATGTMTLSAGAALLSGFEHRDMQVSPAEIAARTHPEDAASVGAVVERALAEGTPYRIDCRVLLPDGELRWIRSQATVEMRDGKAMRITGAIIDITRERVLLDQLRQSAERMRLAEEAAGFGVWESDRLTDTVTVSEGMLRLHELPPDGPRTLTPRDIVTLVDADYVAAVKVATDESFETGQRFEIELPMPLRDGSTSWRRIQGRPEYLNGEPWRLIGATLDITSERQMRRSLEQARTKAEAAAKAKSEFLANMSHEIRTPLNGVIGMTQLLLDSPLTSQQRDWVETAMGSGTALLSIINDILDFSKIEAGKLAIDVLSFDLRRLLEEVAEILAHKAADKGIDLMVRYSPGTPVHLVGDAQRIRQVVLNLANNAVKFTETGHVLITAEAVEHDVAGATVRISVTDTGIGITPQALETLFDKFTQADSSTTRRYGGTGLGLAISKKLVELMNGTIDVRSQEGQGSTFTCTLRLPLGHSDMLPATPAAALRGVRVLLVVDNVVNRRVIREQIAAGGMRDNCATSREALAVVRTAQQSGDPYQVIIADQEVENVEGTTLAPTLRQDPAFRDLVYVMLTSIRQPVDESTLAQRGIDACLVKPVRHARLISTLADAWMRRRAMSTAGSTPTSAAKVASMPSALPQFSGQVLVVEDNLVNQRVAVALLSRLGVRAEVANHGREAIERMKSCAYDLVLMDCQMPVLNGYDATIEIRKSDAGGKRVPIIAMTADVIDGSKQRALDSGMDDFITKPVDVHELSRALRTWLPNAA